MSQTIVILGYGALGAAAAAALAGKGYTLRIAQRSAPAHMPPGASFVRCDVLDPDSLRAAVAGASQVVGAFGFEYDGAVWLKHWPKAMQNLIAACEVACARLVFFDNLYMYGPQTKPLTEDMVLTKVGRKPKARAEVTRIWMAARDAGRLKIAVLRAPDFYGPGVANSHLGDVAFGALAKGGVAQLILSPDLPHDFAYVPDLGRMVATLIEAPDSDYGQVWHSPCAPTRTPREILALGAKALGVKPRVQPMPLAMLPLLGVVVPFLRELNEMRFQFDRPYYVDGSKWTRRFGGTVTPFEIGVAETVRAYAPAAAKAAA